MTKDLERALGRIEGLQEQLLKELDDLKKQTRYLEQKMWTWNGAFAVAFIVWTFLAKNITVALGFQ
jgi:hypothetical protein